MGISRNGVVLSGAFFMSRALATWIKQYQ
jgi:hypothetical protein